MNKNIVILVLSILSLSLIIYSFSLQKKVSELNEFSREQMNKSVALEEQLNRKIAQEKHAEALVQEVYAEAKALEEKAKAEYEKRKGNKK